MGSADLTAGVRREATTETRAGEKKDRGGAREATRRTLASVGNTEAAGDRRRVSVVGGKQGKGMKEKERQESKTS